jgi:hypothetical protein
MFDVNWRGLLLPLAYLVVLVGTFMTFSTVYRKRKARKCSRLCPLILVCKALTLLSLSSPERKPGAMVRPAPATKHLPVAAAYGARGGVREVAQGPR